MRKPNNFIYWTPRILGIIFVLFLILFSLDSSGLGLLIHNLPALFLLVILLVSWKYEIIGGVVFTLGGLLYLLNLIISFSFQLFLLSWSLLISLPALLIGILFLINWFKKKK